MATFTYTGHECSHGFINHDVHAKSLVEAETDYLKFKYSTFRAHVSRLRMRCAHARTDVMHARMHA